MSQRAEWAQDVKKLQCHEVSCTGEMRTLLMRDTSRRFHDLMDLAMLISAVKYGDVAEAYPDRVDAMKSLMTRLEAYEDTGNVEFLVDIANFAMIEFMHPKHRRAHYKHENDGSPGRVVPGVGEFTEQSNRDIALSPAEKRHSSRAGD